jgi:hypothetical protein
MAKKAGRAFLALALLAAGCSRGVGDQGGNRAALSEVCGEAGDAATVRPVAPRPDPRPRVTDDASHLSYLALDAPWRAWTQAVSPGHLGELFNAGYYLVSDPTTPTGEYYATVLSGRVYPGQQQHPDLKCVAEHVAEDLHDGAYPTPNERTDLAAKATSVNGYPAYLVRYRLNYHVSGYDADSEVVTVMVIDTRQPDLAILYTSIPNTVGEYEKLVDQVAASLQVT